MADDPKNLFASKTFWLNTGITLLTLIAPAVQQYVSQHPELATSAVTILNIIARLTTSQPVTVRPKG